MIKSFKHKGLSRFFDNGSLKGIQTNHAPKLRLILGALNRAESIKDLNIPSFRLHPLQGRGKNVYSAWVSGNWRVTFRFTDGEVEIVNYEDYH